MALALAVLELLTVNAKIIEMYLEGLSPDQKAANSAQIFGMLQHLHDGTEKIQGLIERLHLGGGDAPNPTAPPA